jgi:anti-sigma B factor antagonist
MQMLRFRRGNRNAGPHNTALEAGEIAIRIVRASSHCTVTVTHRVTVDSSPHLRSVLLQLLGRAAGSVVVIDLSGVSYLDMSGLATLLEALSASQRASVKLRVIGMSGQSRLLAEIAEMDKIFQTVGSEVEFQ